MTSCVDRCSPVTKIAFMKTHKCASSTIENILFRYQRTCFSMEFLVKCFVSKNRHAYRNDLNVAVPRVGNYLSMMGLFNGKAVARTPWGKLDMHLFALHNRWNYLEVKRLMGADTTTFSIVRNPVDLFESLYAYMRMSRRFGVSIHRFIELIGQKKHDKITNRRINNIYGRNQLAWDLGIGPQHFNNDTYINERIAALNQQFHLVLLVERLEESLVLLRHLLCWPVEHVATLVLNKRKTSKTVKLRMWQRLVLKNWLSADHMIYDYFRKLFDSKVRQFNEQHRHLVSNSSVTPMDMEVTKLRQAVAQLNNKCVVDRVGNEKLTGKFHEFSNDIMGYKVKE